MNSRFDRGRSRGSRARPLVRALCLAALAVSPAWSSPALTLPEAVRLAGERAPSLDARRAELSAAEQESARADALPDPMLMVGVDNLPVTGRDAFDTGVDNMTMTTIGLSQEIPSRAKRAARQSFAERRIDEAQAWVEAEDLDVRGAAARAWIAVWAAQRELDALQALRDQSALAARLARARVAGGDGSVSDALAAEAASLELDNRIEAARAEKRAAQAALARWVGEARIEVAADAPDFGTLPVAQDALLAAVDRVAPLRPVTAQVESAAAAVDVARADKRPDWRVGASYGQRAAGRSDMLMVEIGVGLPLFARNRQDRGVAAREAEYRSVLATREDLRREQAARIRADIARWDGLKRQVALQENAQLPLAHDRSATALAAYRAGGALQPWLDARRDALVLQLAYARHLRELGHAWAALAFLLPTETSP